MKIILLSLNSFSVFNNLSKVLLARQKMQQFIKYSNFCSQQILLLLIIIASATVL